MTLNNTKTNILMITTQQIEAKIIIIMIKYNKIKIIIWIKLNFKTINIKTFKMKS